MGKKNITAAICCLATGLPVPALLSFPRVRENPGPLNGVPEKKDYGLLSVWMDANRICPVWFGHFLKSVKANEDNPDMFSLDGHTTHTKILHFWKRRVKSMCTHTVYRHTGCSCWVFHSCHLRVPIMPKNLAQLKSAICLGRPIVDQPLHVMPRMDFGLLACPLIQIFLLKYNLLWLSQQFDHGSQTAINLAPVQ